MTKPEHLNPAQVAAILGVTTKSLSRARMSQNGPPFVQVSPRVFQYPTGQFEQWMAGRTRGRKPGAGSAREEEPQETLSSVIAQPERSKRGRVINMLTKSQKELVWSILKTRCRLVNGRAVYDMGESDHTVAALVTESFRFKCTVPNVQGVRGQKIGLMSIRPSVVKTVATSGVVAQPVEPPVPELISPPAVEPIPEPTLAVSSETPVELAVLMDLATLIGGFARTIRTINANQAILMEQLGVQPVAAL